MRFLPVTRARHRGRQERGHGRMLREAARGSDASFVSRTYDLYLTDRRGDQLLIGNRVAVLRGGDARKQMRHLKRKTGRAFL